MKVFISYRRKDRHYIADSIYYWLEREFGRDNVFKDVDSVPFGRDFRRFLQDAVARCDALLVVIGPGWLGETDAVGRRRVDDPEDWVRIEIETALERDIPVIPLLVDGASFPREEDLPPSLQELIYRNGTPVRPDPDFRRDMGRLIKALRDNRPQRLVSLGIRRMTLCYIIITSSVAVFVISLFAVQSFRSQEELVAVKPPAAVAPPAPRSQQETNKTQPVSSMWHFIPQEEIEKLQEKIKKLQEKQKTKMKKALDSQDEEMKKALDSQDKEMKKTLDSREGIQ